VTINLAAVVPVPIESLTFSPNPVVGGGNNRVTATITLESAAPMDIPITVQSNNTDVATVTGTVTVPKGATSATFEVIPLLQTEPKEAVIQAFYAERIQEPLTVQPPL
jgi:hypothetical protein